MRRMAGPHRRSPLACPVPILLTRSAPAGESTNTNVLEPHRLWRYRIVSTSALLRWHRELADGCAWGRTSSAFTHCSTSRNTTGTDRARAPVSASRKINSSGQTPLCRTNTCGSACGQVSGVSRPSRMGAIATRMLYLMTIRLSVGWCCSLAPSRRRMRRSWCCVTRSPCWAPAGHTTQGGLG